jgi:hypothetical protein
LSNVPNEIGSIGTSPNLRWLAVMTERAKRAEQSKSSWYAIKVV